MGFVNSPMEAAVFLFYRFQAFILTATHGLTLLLVAVIKSCKMQHSVESEPTDLIGHGYPVFAGLLYSPFQTYIYLAGRETLIFRKDLPGIRCGFPRFFIFIVKRETDYISRTVMLKPLFVQFSNPLIGHKDHINDASISFAKEFTFNPAGEVALSFNGPAIQFYVQPNLGDGLSFHDDALLRDFAALRARLCSISSRFGY